MKKMKQLFTKPTFSRDLCLVFSIISLLCLRGNYVNRLGFLIFSFLSQNEILISYAVGKTFKFEMENLQVHTKISDKFSP